VPEAEDEDDQRHHHEREDTGGNPEHHPEQVVDPLSVGTGGLESGQNGVFDLDQGARSQQESEPKQGEDASQTTGTGHRFGIIRRIPTGDQLGGPASLPSASGPSHSNTSRRTAAKSAAR